MKYFLLIFLAGSGPPPSPAVVGPFSSALACEAAASKAEMVAHKVYGNRRIGTVCVEHQLQVLVLPKGVK